MEKMFIVCWGASSCDDRGNAHANVGIHGVYSTRGGAKIGLVDCKDQLLEETKNAVDPDGEYPELLDELDIKVYGSEAEEYFEIDYILGTEPCEVCIKIIEQYN